MDRIKTFDLAKEYFKDLDYSTMHIFEKIKDEPDPATQELANKIEAQLCAYLKDERNVFSNDYYRGTVAEACVYHYAELAHGRTSFFDVAIEIIEGNRDILKSNFETYKQTTYPLIMVERFLDYCAEQTPRPFYLSDEAEGRLELFMTAYHYIIDENS